MAACSPTPAQANAAVTNSSQRDGSLVARSFVGKGDVHLGSRAGSLDTLLSGASVTAVPEPASCAMMVTGFGLIGGALRGQRRGVSPPSGDRTRLTARAQPPHHRWR